MPEYAPYLRLPILEIDGNVKLTQSIAIARHLAREFGIDGQTPMQKTESDVVVDICNELFNDLMTITWQSFKDEDIALQNIGPFLIEVAPRLLGQIEEIYDKNGGPFVTGPTVPFATCIYFLC